MLAAVLSVFASVFTALLTIICVTIVYLYYFSEKSFSYWKRRNVPFYTPSFPFGNFGENFTGRKAIGEAMQTIYHSTNAPAIGLWTFWKPVVLIRDLKVIQSIMVTDFATFVDRGFYEDEKRDPISAHLFSMTGDKWRSLRAKLSPTFTTGKLKAMFSTFIDCSDKLSLHVGKLVEQNDPIDARDLLARYATDIIVSVGFGIEANCIDNPNTEFRQMGKRFFAQTFKNGLKNMALLLFPDIMKLMGMKFTDELVEKFMYNMVKSNMDYRQKNKVVRKDFFQMLLQLRNTGKIGLDDEWDASFSETKIENLTLDEIVAQTFLFYLAGFETTSTTITFCLYELAKNVEIQNDVYQEFLETLAANDGKVTYDSINSMKLLDRCVDETLRKYPAVQMLSRVGTEEYTIPETKFTIDAGTKVFIPVFSLHRDPKYYENPLKFMPQRFEDPSYIKDKPYLPFGDGPRFCIGQRMAIIMVKVGLISMIKNTIFTLDENTPNEIRFDPANIALQPIEIIMLKGSKRG